MKLLLLFIVVFAGLSVSQIVDNLPDGFEDIRIIDSFSRISPVLLIAVPNSPSFPLFDSNTVNARDFSDGIFGDQRNLALTVTSGDIDSTFSTGISNDDFTCSTPQEGTAFTVLQYDGGDDTSTLSPGGLFTVAGLNTDLTNRNAFAIHAIIESDQPTTIDFRIYSGSSADYCSFIAQIPGDDTLHDYIFNYNDFVNIGAGCNFQNAGAIEVIVDMFENVDVLMQLLATWGPDPVTPTPTRTKTPSPSPLVPSVPPPSETPSPLPSGCRCRCPVFVCNIFRVEGEYNFGGFGGFIPNFFGNQFFGVQFFGGQFFDTFFFQFFDPGFFNPGFFNPGFFNPGFFDTQFVPFNIWYWLF